MTSLHVECRVTCAAAAPSERVLHCAAMFGLGVDDRREMCIVPSREIPMPAGGIVFITGPSGGGKSTLLRLLAQAASAVGLGVIDDNVPQPAPGLPLIDCLGSTLEDALRLLSLAGLADAFVMIRHAGELSDGQRRRFNLARLLEAAEASADRAIILADEFAATLDRITAMAIARSLRRWITRTAHTLIIATTHDDLLEPLQPDVLVWKGLGEELEVLTRSANGGDGSRD